jgi:hypothetical protein
MNFLLKKNKNSTLEKLTLCYLLHPFNVMFSAEGLSPPLAILWFSPRFDQCELCLQYNIYIFSFFFFFFFLLRQWIIVVVQFERKKTQTGFIQIKQLQLCLQQKKKKLILKGTQFHARNENNKKKIMFNCNNAFLQLS